MLTFTAIGWVLIISVAIIVGASKTGIPGAGILAVPMMALAMADAPQQSVGFLLPLLCMADVLAVVYWRRHANWSKLVWLMPWALVGILIGYFCHQWIQHTGHEEFLAPVIGVIVLVLLGVTLWRRSRAGAEAHIPTHWTFAAAMGLLAGTTTMLANAAGPIMMIYLLAMRLKKEEFLGTGAWYFFIMNLVKVPFLLDLGMITPASFGTNLTLLPAIVIGGVSGILLVKRIPNAVFQRIIQVLAAAAAILLTVRGIVALLT